MLSPVMQQVLAEYDREIYEMPGASTFVRYVRRDDVSGGNTKPKRAPWMRVAYLAFWIAGFSWIALKRTSADSQLSVNLPSPISESTK